MKSIIDRMLWVPKSQIDVKKVKQSLCVAGTTFRGPETVLQMYEETDKYLGVPRAWGLRQKWMHGSELHDETVAPYLKWPEFAGSYRDGQEKSVKAMLKAMVGDGNYGGLLEAKTGTGKTVMGVDIASKLNTPLLVVVHKEDLADQWRMLLDGGIKEGKQVLPLWPGGQTGHVQGDKWDFRDRHLVTAMAQTLYARRNKIPAEFFDTFGAVVFDEGHRYPAATFEQVMRMSHARYRYAVSATWRRKDSLECVWNWHIGEVAHRTQGVHLVGQYVQVPWNTNVHDGYFRRGSFLNTAGMITSIADNVPYNVWLTGELIKGAKAGRQVLLVSHRTKQLSDIRKRILKAGEPVTVGYYAGKVDGKTIKKAELEVSKGCNIILATYSKMAEGTDIATLDTLFLGTPASDIEQVVGRIQRPQSDKQSLLVVDPVWDTKYNQALANKRRQIYSKLGFKRQGE